MAAWTYSDWITYETTSATRLSRLRLHIQEVSDKLSSGSYSIPGFSTSKGELVSYLDRLRVDEPLVAQAVQRATGARVGFTRGNALR